jgi:osmotically-inducible protein OsmY
MAALLAAAMVALPVTVFGAVEDLSDTDITAAIETELVTEDAVASHLLDVQTTDGIVTLSGTVDNLLAKQRSIEIAKATKGVRSVVDQLEVEPVSRTDDEIETDVVAALAADPAADSYELDVKVDKGVVSLSGTVESWQEKNLAGMVAKGVRGVKDVTNNVTVRYKVERADPEIEADVKRRLETDTLVDHLLIDVDVEDGEVELTGTVGSAAERSRARTDAWVTGVESVDASGLKVEWWARDEMRRSSRYPALTDQEIEKAVRDALVYDPRVFSFNPDVSVEGGVVTLTGKVEDYRAKRAAEDTAQNTVGVWRVKNHLRVRPAVRPDDKELAEKVRKALARDPYVERQEIDVVVLNGNVYLYGDVDSYFDKMQAEDVASGVSGVIDVTNSLTVLEEMPPVTDRELEQDIEDQMYWDTYVDSEDITVKVRDGVATLKGEVDSWFEYRQAAENAYDAGATRVVNRLEVTNGKTSWWPW